MTPRVEAWPSKVQAIVPGVSKPQSTVLMAAECGASTRKVPLDQGRWELLSLPSPGSKEHLSSAIVAWPGEDAGIV
jgi:hypothetical protein